MLSNLFFWTRFYLLNFNTMWALPVAAFLTLLALRLLLGGKQPCKTLLFLMPALYVLVAFVNAYLFTADDLSLFDLLQVLARSEVCLIFGWLGLLLATVIDTVIRQLKGSASA